MQINQHADFLRSLFTDALNHKPDLAFYTDF